MISLVKWFCGHVICQVLYHIFHLVLSQHLVPLVKSNRDYILANLIGEIPSTALEVAIGTDIVNFQENMGRLGIIVVVAGIVYFILWKVYKNYINKKNAEQGTILCLTISN